MSEQVQDHTTVATRADGSIHCEGLVKIFKVADLEVVALQGLDLDVDVAHAQHQGAKLLRGDGGGLDHAGRRIVDEGEIGLALREAEVDRAAGLHATELAHRRRDRTAREVLQRRGGPDPHELVVGEGERAVVPAGEQALGEEGPGDLHALHGDVTGGRAQADVAQQAHVDAGATGNVEHQRILSGHAGEGAGAVARPTVLPRLQVLLGTGVVQVDGSGEKSIHETAILAATTTGECQGSDRTIGNRGDPQPAAMPSLLGTPLSEKRSRTVVPPASSGSSISRASARDSMTVNP